MSLKPAFDFTTNSLKDEVFRAFGKFAILHNEFFEYCSFWYFSGICSFRVR